MNFSMHDNQIKSTKKTNQISPASRLVFLRIFPLTFIFVGIVVLYLGGRGIYLARESTGWPSANGVVQNSTMEYHSSKESRGSYHAEVLYQFHVKGQAHSGNRIAFGFYSEEDPSHAQKIVNRYPKGKSVKVYYRESDPDLCVLEPGIQAQTWLLPSMGLVFFVIGILIAVFLPKLLREKQTEDEG